MDDLSIGHAAAALLIVLPIAFNALFLLLARLFDYPSVLRSPAGVVLSRFHAGGARLRLVWFGFTLTAVLFAPLTVTLGQALEREELGVVRTATAIGVLATVVQFLGLARWPFLVPLLARIHDDPAASQPRRDAAVVVFEAFHRYLGVGVGESLGYLLTGAWTTLIGIALVQSTELPTWLGVVGIVIGPALMTCSLEFVGRFEVTGWKPAERLTSIAYVAWSLWLAATGIALLV